MRLTRAYVATALRTGDRMELPAAPAAHVARVLRARSGDSLVLFNGDGREYAARIESVSGTRVAISVGDSRPVDRESPIALTLLQCIARGDRMDWIVQKATELGVHRIVPLLSERSVVKFSGRQAESKAAHWRAVAASACEQCGRNRLPTIETPLTLADFLGADPHTGERLVFDPDADDPAPAGTAPVSQQFAIGPEGGFAPDEIDALRAAGYRGLRLGPRILRADTAAVAALVWLQSRFGDLHGARQDR